MKNNLMKFAVVACVAFFALNSQSQAASVHVELGGKSKVCCAEKAHVVVKHKVKKDRKCHCDKHARDRRHDRHVVRHRKVCCRHGR